MEWVSVTRPLLSDSTTDRKRFQPGSGYAKGASKSLALQATQHISTNKPLVQRQLPNEEAWNQWLEEGSYTNVSTCPGFSLLLCGRPAPSSKIPARLFKVPIPKEHLNDVLRKFHIHKRISRVMERGRIYMDASELPQIDAATPNYVYTSNFSSDITNYHDRLAFATTYLSSPQSSCGIIFGCTDEDMKTVVAMLEDCETSWNHPLLLPYIFVELQTRRLNTLADTQIDLSEKTGFEFETLRNRGDDERIYEVSQEFLDVRDGSSIVEAGLKAAIGQLSKLIAHSEALLLAPKRAPEQTEEQAEKKAKEEAKQRAEDLIASSDAFIRDTERFISRFKQIILEYEELIDNCQINVKSTTSILDAYANQVARRSTVKATVLTFIAMIYLPATTMATILAIPIFKFEADWRDIFGHPAPAGNDDNSNGSSSATSSASLASSSDSTVPVVSFYLWVYIAMSVGLTWLTVEAWWLTTHIHHNLVWHRSPTIRAISYCIKFPWEIVLSCWTLLAGTLSEALTWTLGIFGRTPDSATNTNSQASDQEKGQASRTSTSA